MDPRQQNDAGVGVDWDQPKDSWRGSDAWEQVPQPQVQGAHVGLPQKDTGIFSSTQPNNMGAQLGAGQPINQSTPQQSMGIPTRDSQSIQKNEQGGYNVVPPLQQKPQSASGHNPYEFIMQPGNIEPPKGLGGNGMVKRMVIAVIGIALLLALIGFFIAAFGPKDTITPALVSIVQEQQEIIRVASKGQESTSERTRAFAASTLYSVSTNQTELKEYLAAKKAAPNSKILGAKRSADTDKILASAKESNTFDSALQQSLNAQLTDYQTNLSSTYKKLSSKKSKAVIERSYTAVKLLLQQGSATSTTTTTPQATP